MKKEMQKLSKTNRRVVKLPYCAHCKNMGLEYNSHFLRETMDPNSAIVCPILLNTDCKFCKIKGHTISKCPSNPKIQLTGIKPIDKPVIKPIVVENDVSSYASVLIQGKRPIDPIPKPINVKPRSIKRNWADECSSDEEDDYF